MYGKMQASGLTEFITLICTWAAAAKSLQSCQTLCDPINGSHQAPLSLGFSRQEHWGGLPFPSPMHESEKWKWSRSVVSRLLATPWIAAYQPPPSMGFSRQSTGVGCHELSGAKSCFLVLLKEWQMCQRAASCISVPRRPLPRFLSNQPGWWWHLLDLNSESVHSHLEARNHWWLWHFFFIDMAGDIFISQ